MGTRDELLGLLADGGFHSGNVLADRLNLSRTAVWKHLRKLSEYGLVIEAVPGRGYQLGYPLELLNSATIVGELDAGTAKCLDQLEVYGVIESTSGKLRSGPKPAPDQLRVCVAEYQTGGRGRRGRQWLSPYGSGICMSVSWHFENVPGDLSSLSLAAGVAVIRAVEACGFPGLSLKWPNDLILNHGKVAGILVDVEGESDGPLTAVIGIGLNVEMPDSFRTSLTDEGHLPPVALADTLTDVQKGHSLSRNRIAASLIMTIHRMLVEFSGTGFSSFAEQWQRYDYLLGREVRVMSASYGEQGTACGIGSNGSLLLDVDGEIKQVVSGEVSVRRAS